MKKPNITGGNWKHSEEQKKVVSDIDMGDILICDIDYMGSCKDEEMANGKAISATHNLIDALISIMEDVKLTKYMGSVRRVKAINALKKAGVQT